jgi:hypothetical protein
LDRKALLVRLVHKVSRDRRVLWALRVQSVIRVHPARLDRLGRRVILATEVLLAREDHVALKVRLVLTVRAAVVQQAQRNSRSLSIVLVARSRS